MSIGKTLLKVAIGVVIAKGVARLTKGSSVGPDTAPRVAARGSAPSGRKAGLEDMMGISWERTRKNRGGATETGGTAGWATFWTRSRAGSGKARGATAPKGGLDGLWGELTGHGSGPVAPKGGRAGAGSADLLDQVLADRPGVRAARWCCPNPSARRSCRRP
jgi:hypothetical protein